ncbi:MULTISPECIES: UxaA family hydrolase [unclassified Sulfitobacter]|uniref:UxaA family hydrolase n=2 Tax=Roseobacteraceae TaxID=2854170 RepID=UPI0023E0EC3A|nr:MULTISPECIES: UxaA family hydrolase [unclassified Sulfitobacter]MDF3382651.1 hydro-lyase [Sulfitobacter sp. Ks11]MDF3386070.1 hydro-lyase [Sulfitobacter sp. M85]MDF3389489.1 hydro-lyase [Sulfitobacter sp. Ks16]MDF3400126.1 hydro-lyase [Sulfitobacter sp. KE39]MDF3403547.1 hydro-lyase [Sulfitobacter sp. Ks35]
MSIMWPEPGLGWARTDSAPGIRNHVIAFSTVALADRAVAMAAERVPGSLELLPQFERGLRGNDATLQAEVIKRVVQHPNVGAALVVTHDRAAALALEAEFSVLPKPIKVCALMGFSGMESAVSEMANLLEFLSDQAAQNEKVELQWRDLTVALECGGSDATSAICANPAIGRFVDHLLSRGGRAIVSETAEFLGGEHVVEQSCDSPAIAKEIIARIQSVENLMLADGHDYRGVNPTQENIEAGLTTLTEKTMGALCKIGKNRFSGCLDFAEAPEGQGLFFMDTPFFSPVSLSGMILGGAQVSLFAMGVFNPSGMPLAPTIKICGNTRTLEDWGASIDIDVAHILTGAIDLDEAAQLISRSIRNLSLGEKSKAEFWSEGQMIIPRTAPAL